MAPGRRVITTTRHQGHPLAHPPGERHRERVLEALQPGTFFYYTRVVSPVNATIEHRWYRNDRLHRTVPLRIRANAREGFRTYSRMTVSPERAGDWRVEVRTTSGDSLQEARFTVQ